MALSSEHHGKATGSRAMALHQSSVYGGTILGGTVAGYCGDYYGWRAGFYLFGSLGIVLAAVLVFALREPARGAADETQDRPEGGASDSSPSPPGFAGGEGRGEGGSPAGQPPRCPPHPQPLAPASAAPRAPLA